MASSPSSPPLSTLPTARPSASINPFRTLQRHRNFRVFWLGQTLSLVGTWMQTMAMGWLALDLSNSPFVVGMVVAATSLPVLLLSFHAGVLVDRVEKLRLLKAAQVALFFIAVALWWLTWSDSITIAWLLAMATLGGIVAAVEIPARQSLVIELVGREDLPGAIALNSSGFNLARVVGPSLGALVIARFGIEWTFGVNAVSYAWVLGGLMLVRLPPWTPPETRASPLEGIREGFRYLRDTPVMSALMRTVTVYSVLGVPYLVMMPVVARDRLGMGAGGYGLLLACVGIGGLAGALSLAAVGDRFAKGKMLAGSSYVFAGLLVAFSFVRTAALAYPLLLVIGFAMIVTNALANSLVQHLVPDALRGRMMAAYSFVVVGLSQVVGALFAGSVARLVGVDWAIGGAAAAMLAYAYWAFHRRPELRGL